MASNCSRIGESQVKMVLFEMGIVVGVMGLCFVMVMVMVSHVFTSLVSKEIGASMTVVEGWLYIDGTASIASTDRDFICATLDWWPPQKCDYGTCSWGTASLLNLDLNNKILFNAIKAFSPLKLRLGGTLQNKVMYQRPGDQQPCPPFTINSTLLFGFTQACLPMARWDELNLFFNKSSAKVIFGLNALSSRRVSADGSVVGAWDSSNAEVLMRYTLNKGFVIHGWELGNELSGTGIGARITADQYASDTIALQRLVQTIYKRFRAKPIVLGPGGFFDANWFTEYATKATGSIQAITQHVYNLGPGVDNHLVEKILDPSYLDGGSQPFRDLRNILEKSGASTVAWVGEAGGVCNSGRNHVSNAFVFSFWYLDQLGMASLYDTKTYCRQTLVGGNYGLLNTVTFVPNPDYYSALLWHRLMGSRVLSTSFNDTTKIRSYAHCAKNSGGITLLLINLDGITKVKLGISVQNKTITALTRQPKPTRTTKFSGNGKATREEYHLTAKKGNLKGQTVLLNGKELSVNSSGIIPPLEPIQVNISSPVTVAPFSIVFVHIPSIHVLACK